MSHGPTNDVRAFEFRLYTDRYVGAKTLDTNHLISAYTVFHASSTFNKHQQIVILLLYFIRLLVLFQTSACRNLGPVVQRIIGLTSSLVLVNCSSKNNI